MRKVLGVSCQQRAAVKSGSRARMVMTRETLMRPRDALRVTKPAQNAALSMAVVRNCGLLPRARGWYRTRPRTRMSRKLHAAARAHWARVRKHQWTLSSLLVFVHTMLQRYHATIRPPREAAEEEAEEEVEEEEEEEEDSNFASQNVVEEEEEEEEEE